jgi:uridine kinase
MSNFDHPDAFDYDLLTKDLTKLLEGEKIPHPIYDYKTHTRMKETKMVGPADLIILEGILILNNARLRELMHFSVFVETDLDICFIRRFKRDITERARTMDSVIQQYNKTVRPMYLKFIEPSKQYADILIPRGGKNIIAIDILSTKIGKLLNDNR